MAIINPCLHGKQLMKTQFVPLNELTHQHLKINNKVDYRFFEQIHMLPLLVPEFMSAANSFPIIFTKNAETGEFLSVAVTSLRPQANQLLNQGVWRSRYLPLQVQLYPLGMTKISDDRLIVGIDLNNTSVSETGDNPLFTADGHKSEYLNHKLKLVSLQADYQEQTRHFIKALLQADLLQARVLTVTSSQGVKTNIDGIYTVDEQKLSQLSDEAMLALAKRGFYAPIYAHLCSLNLFDLVMDNT